MVSLASDAENMLKRRNNSVKMLKTIELRDVLRRHRQRYSQPSFERCSLTK